MSKIEEMGKASVSTPDVLGVMAGMALDDRLAKLEPGDEAAKSKLLLDFGDRTGVFVGEIQPFLIPSADPMAEIEEGEHNLLRAGPLLPDDLEPLKIDSTAWSLRGRRTRRFRQPAEDNRARRGAGG